MKSIFVLILSCVLMASCQNQKSKSTINSDIVNNPATLSEENQGQKLPVLTFETVDHDFGPIPEGEKREFEFKFTNTGEAPLLISDVRASCGCTTPYWPKGVIQPGKSEVIKVEFNSKGKKGQFSKTITITANTYPNTTKLTISGLVKEE